MPKKVKKRLDVLIVEKGLVTSREKAKALIMTGNVIVNDRVADKPGTEVDENAAVVIKEDLPYVGRGGIKLEGALNNFNIDVNGIVIMDVGASTGGFTDCLLQRGAKKIFAIDVGKGLLDWKLRNDERVKVIEGKNIRHLQFDDIGEFVDMAVIDVSFISLKIVMPNVMNFIKNSGYILALIKPQFEVGKGMVGKGGIVRDSEKQEYVIDRIKEFSISIGLDVKGVAESPITGAKGNREFWIWLNKIED
ncbi:MAG: TlyA family RNA methyltransferase [Deltaproteobacteria bacterium]|nr:TlyA family RNA methyltransferase [Deltaproteobacteria bacterium]